MWGDTNLTYTLRLHLQDSYRMPPHLCVLCRRFTAPPFPNLLLGLSLCELLFIPFGFYLRFPLGNCGFLRMHVHTNFASSQRSGDDGNQDDCYDWLRHNKKDKSKTNYRCAQPNAPEPVGLPAALLQAKHIYAMRAIINFAHVENVYLHSSFERATCIQVRLTLNVIC